MTLIWIAAAGFLVWYLVTHKEQRLVWPWVGLGLLALPLLHGGRFMGRMGGGMMGRGMKGGGMMGGGHMNGMMGGGHMNGGMMGGGHMGGGHMNGMMGGGHMSGMMDAWGSFWWVPMAIHAVLLIALVWVGAVVIRRAWKAYSQRTSPLGVLQMRLARGEIGADEYEAARAKLQG